MKSLFRAALIVVAIAAAPHYAQCQAQQDSQADKTPSAAATTPHSGAAKKPTERSQNIQAYIDLMRENVRQNKAEIMGSMMALDSADADKFWNIYSDYDAELTKLNDMRVANIEDYAKNYDSLTDAKADELIQHSIDFQKKRAELLYSTYEKMKQAIGGVNAARFAQIEHQLLLIIDLQIDAALPIAPPKS
jgi:hypothetical protein